MSLSAMGFMAFYFIGLLVTLVRGPIWGFLVYLGVFYVHPLARWWGDEVPNWRWTFYASIIILISSFMHKKQIKKKDRSWYDSGAAKLFIAYVIWMWIQSAWAVNPEEHLENCILYTKYLVLFYLIYTIIDEEKKLLWFSLAHVAGCFYLGWEAFDAGGGKLDGVGGPGINEANRLGTHLSTGVMYAAMLILAAENRVRYLCIGFVPLILNGVILTLSRGAFLGLVAGGISLAFLKPKSKAREFKMFAILGLVLFMLVAHQQFWDRLNTLTAPAEERDGSASSRLIIIEGQWEIFKDYPMGTGSRGTRTLAPIYLSADVLEKKKGSRSSHNTYMTVLVDQGIPGVIIYLGMIFWSLSTLRKLNKLDKNGLSAEYGMFRAAIGASLMTVSVAGMFSSYFRAEVLLWAFASLVVLRDFIASENIGGVKNQLHSRRLAGGVGYKKLPGH